MIAAQSLQSVVEPTVVGLGYELWGMERSRSPHGALLRIFIDSPEGITLDDCEKVSRQLRDLLEAEQLLDEDGLLEISSPGVDRPLFTPEQFLRFVGEHLQLRTRLPQAGRRQFHGRLVTADEHAIELKGDDFSIRLPYSDIDKARVVHQWPVNARAPRGSSLRKKTGE